MWPFSCSTSADSCSAPPPSLTLGGLASVLPFLAILAASHTLATRHLLPRLGRAHDDSLDGEEHELPLHAPEALRAAHAEHGARGPRRRLTAALFGATVGLATTLASLILAEILGVADPVARSLALAWTVRSLLVMLVAVLPFMECRSLLSAAGWRFTPDARGRLPRAAWAVQFGLFGVWLLLFAAIGSVVPGPADAPVTAADIAAAAAKSKDDPGAASASLVDRLTRACLERVGIVGICLMALLAGFAAVSTPWYTFGARRRGRRPLTEADIARRQDGLDAAREMLATKRHRLQALGRRAAGSSRSASPVKGAGLGGFMRGVMGGQSGDEADMRALRVEIAGLESVEANLATGLTAARGQLDAEQRSQTAAGRALVAPTYVFSCYCAYRVVATALTTLRRLTAASALIASSASAASSSSGGTSGSSIPPHEGSSSFSATDPINRFLGLAARHWDPNLDTVAWARTVSFLLSGVMLLLSASSVVQTLALFSRWAPPVIQRRANASLALAVGHVAATYVISSALLLRSHLPRQVSSDVSGALLLSRTRTGPSSSLGATPDMLLTPAFADSWFESWFLVAAALTAVGIWIGRSVAGPEEDEFLLDDVGQKRS